MVIPWGRQNPSGAQNLSGGQRFLPAHWGLAVWKITVAAIPFLRLPFPNQRPGPFSAVGAHRVRPRAAEVVGPYGKMGEFPITFS